MSNPHRRRTRTNQKPRSQKGRKSSNPPPTAKSRARLFAVTFDPKTAEIVKLESLDSSGSRQELSEAEKAKLASMAPREELEDVVEQVFEAGIACGLGADEPDHNTKESAAEAELRRLLLTPLIEQSPVGPLLQREALSRAILGTLIRNSIAPSSSSQRSHAGAARSHGARQ
jgi:hypothetical protein